MTVNWLFQSRSVPAVITYLGYSPRQDDVSTEGALGVKSMFPAEVSLRQRHGQRSIWILLERENTDPLVKP